MNTIVQRKKPSTKLCGINPETNRCRKPPMGEGAPHEKCMRNEDTNFCRYKPEYLKQRRTRPPGEPRRPRRQNPQAIRLTKSEKSMCGMNPETGRCAKPPVGQKAPHPMCRKNEKSGRCVKKSSGDLQKPSVGIVTMNPLFKPDSPEKSATKSKSKSKSKTPRERSPSPPTNKSSPSPKKVPLRRGSRKRKQTKRLIEEI